MTEPALLLAKSWEQDKHDPTGWWMSEKLDGLRAYWDGQQFISRLGNTFAVPEWFTEGLPAIPLDGELWAGRKRFQFATSVVRKQDRGDRWREIRYLVFDAPAELGTFEHRLMRVCQVVEPAAYAHAHFHEPCRGVEHLREELARVEALGAEGLMLRKPGSPYIGKRSSTLLKVKSFHDTEGRVTGYQPGKGKHLGRLGAVVLVMADGTVVEVGTGFSDAERESPPPIGSVVTFRYQELSDGGVPRFPSYVGVREDVTL